VPPLNGVLTCRAPYLGTLTAGLGRRPWSMVLRKMPAFLFGQTCDYRSRLVDEMSPLSLGL
jgi:hypothetical protein